MPHQGQNGSFIVKVLELLDLAENYGPFSGLAQGGHMRPK